MLTFTFRFTFSRGASQGLLRARSDGTKDKVIGAITWQEELETKRKELIWLCYAPFFMRKGIRDPVRFPPTCYNDWDPPNPYIKIYLHIFIRHLNRKNKAETWNIGYRDSSSVRPEHLG